MKIRVTIMLAVLSLITAGPGVLVLNAENAPDQQTKAKLVERDKDGRSLVFRKHLEELQKTLPGNEGSGEEDPAGYAAQKLGALAYPDNDIPYNRILSSQSAFKNLKKRGFPKGKGRSGTWISIGPSNANNPAFEFRDTTLYLPNQYTAAGRTTSLAIAPVCNSNNCRVWAGAAGGGVWRTDNALAGTPGWRFLSGSFENNAIGSIYQDPNDASGNTLYVGTGEANASGDSLHGVGLYKTTDGGNTWTGPLGKSVFGGRAVGTIAVEPGSPNVIYAASTRGVHGVASVSGGGFTVTIPGAAIWGLYKSTDGGANWTYIHNGGITVAPCIANSAATIAAGGVTDCSPRGVRRILIDPVDPLVVYAASYARGTWRSPDGGATWTQIKTALTSASTSRPELAITLLGNGDTRMYIAEGASGSPTSRLFRSDSVRTGVPVFTNLTSSNPADPGFGSFDYCTGQCWYDQYVYTPPGHPDIVYLGGSFQYSENDPFPTPTGQWISNGRGAVLSQDAGVSFTDVTNDSTDFIHPNGLHPDHHFLVTSPSNPFLFFEAGDGGVVRSNGKLVDISSQCDVRASQFNLVEPGLSRCKQILSAVPERLYSINKGLTTLQFQSLSVDTHNSTDVQGGTQDNGTFESYGNTLKWDNTMIGDGGQSGFDVGVPEFRFHTFFVSQVDANFKNGATIDWNWISDPFFIFGQGQSGSFYIPIINDPVTSQTLFAGINNVWRTKTLGRGSMTTDELRQHCNEWTGDFTVICGDWERLGPLTLSSASFGNRSGGFVTAVERAPGDSSTLWASTSTGRLFVSKNADTDPASSVSFARIDSLTATNDPGRFITGVFVDPADANHAWITYSAFSATTPTEPGHVFSVLYDPIGGSATWTNIDGNLGDIPINDIVFDSHTGDLYISSDYGVYVDVAGGAINWQLAAPGMPNVEVPGLTIHTKDRKLFAATHGLSAWQLRLP